MDYIVFYRTLDVHHHRWGPQWTHRYETVSINRAVADNEDVAAIHDELAKEHRNLKLEIVSILPVTSVTTDYTSQNSEG